MNIYGNGFADWISSAHKAKHKTKQTIPKTEIYSTYYERKKRGKNVSKRKKIIRTALPSDTQTFGPFIS